MDSSDSELQFPGLKRRDNGRTYWYATKAAVSAGFSPSIIRIHENDLVALSSRCLDLQKQMLTWLAYRHVVDNPNDPTISWLIRQYRTREESPYQSIKWNTRRTYGVLLDNLESAAGNSKLRNINLAFLQKLYASARWPNGKGKGNPDRASTAYGIVSIVRRIISFGVAAELNQCVRISTILEKTRFQQPKRRQAAINYDHVSMFVECALAQIDPPRFSLALGMALQFECAMRQKDVIGEWEPIPDDGATSPYVLNSRQWVNGLEWSHISSEMILSKRTTKTGAIVTWDLTLCPTVFELMQRVPESRRFGPVIIDENVSDHRPYATDSYQHEWRRVADMASIPRGIWNMDSRAGAATEAENAGATLGMIQPALGHSDQAMTARYVRGGGLAHTRAVSQLRITHRANEDNASRALARARHEKE